MSQPLSVFLIFKMGRWVTEHCLDKIEKIGLFKMTFYPFSKGIHFNIQAKFMEEFPHGCYYKIYCHSKRN